MSLADKIFIDNCRDILENGIWDLGQNVRPRWESDGAPAHTVKKFGIVNRYDLSKEFPILTVRRTFMKSAIDELLWIWQKKSNNIRDLGSHVWDQWADGSGSIGKAYGYQLGQAYRHHKGTEPGLMAERYLDCDGNLTDRDAYPSAFVKDGWVWMDQVDAALYDIRNNPASRRIMTNIFNHQDLADMHLQPCAYSVTFNVSGDRLNAVLNQRSQDMLTANNWNVVQYAVLVHMFARAAGLKPGELVHVIADAHIYDRHVPIVKEIIGNPRYPAPVLHISPGVNNFYGFTKDDFSLTGYNYTDLDQRIPIAV